MEHLQGINQRKLDYERICILYSNINIGYLGMFLAICFLYFVVSMYSSPMLANIWVACMFVTYIPRVSCSILFARKLKKQLITIDNIKPWERYMTLTSILPYLCLASVIYLPYGENELVCLLYCAFIFMTLATGGVMTITTSLGTIIWFISLTFLSIVIKFILLQDLLNILLGCLLFAGYLLSIKSIIKLNKTLIDNIRLKIENNQYALMDPLTKLWNRRRLNLHIEKLIPATIRSNDPFCLIMLDIDHFKKYNDTYGHSAGDELLTKIAGILEECSREQDLVVRYGGEEFLVVLPQTTINDAAIIAERILTTVKNKTDVTISAGLAEFNKEMDFGQLVKIVDDALYCAKENGRDQYSLSST